MAEQAVVDCKYVMCGTAGPDCRFCQSRAKEQREPTHEHEDQTPGGRAALLLSAGSALAVPATAETDLNVRSGPGTQFPVIGSIPDGQTVDVANCSGAWCQVSFGGGTGYASQNYLEIGGAVAPGPAVAVSPYVYDDDDYDYGYTYGPSSDFTPARATGAAIAGTAAGTVMRATGRATATGTGPVVRAAHRRSRAERAVRQVSPGRPRTGSVRAPVSAPEARHAAADLRAVVAVAVPPRRAAPSGGGGAQPGFAGSMVRGTR